MLKSTKHNNTQIKNTREV